MSRCATHSWPTNDGADPNPCPYCTIAEMDAANAKLHAEIACGNQLRGRIAELEQREKWWKELHGIRVYEEDAAIPERVNVLLRKLGLCE